MGLCPECLVRAGFPSGGETETRRPGFIPPTVEELARNFPQLEILSVIGQGGMGAVYKVRQPKLNRIAALKILPPTISNEPAFAQRFTREAQALAQLNHPGIVTLYEFGESNGQFYFLMEFVDGVNLRQLLQAERVSAREALAIVPQICDALQFAHDQGVVHRDIKPENILLDRRGRVKVADFGLAKLVGTEGESSGGQGTAQFGSLTESGKVMGTPQYMPPEQRENPAEVDHRADIYALGVVFYQMLTGELPGKPIVPPSRACGKVHVDVRLDEIVLRALQQKPELRYQQASVLRTEVETVATSLTSAPGAGASAQAASPQPSFKLTAAVGTAWLLLGLGLLLLGNFSEVASGWWGYWLLGLCLLPSGAYLLELSRCGSSKTVAPSVPPLPPVKCPVSMDTWLSLMDTGEYECSWDVAAPYLQRSVTKPEWVARLEKIRRPLGEVLARKPVTITQTVAGTRYEGVHESSFQNLAAATEIVTYAKQPDGEWQPIGYEVKPRQAPRNGARTVRIIAIILLLGTSSLIGISMLVYLFARADGNTITETQTSAAPHNMVFGPVKEVTLNSSSEKSGLHGLDFESGKLLTAPASVSNVFVWSSWMAEQSIDLLVSHKGGSKWQVGGLGTKLAAVPSAWWESASLAELQGKLDGAKMEEQAGLSFLSMRSEEGKPQTFSFQTSGGAVGILQTAEFTASPRAVKIRYKLVHSSPIARSSVANDKVMVEDLALQMIVAIREKDDAKLRNLASDRIKGWPESLPQFAVELRERYRQNTGNESFDMRAGESLVDGDFAAVRCTGPQELEGKCVVLFFVKTQDGWLNHSLRASMESVPLTDSLAALKKKS